MFIALFDMQECFRPSSIAFEMFCRADSIHPNGVSPVGKGLSLLAAAMVPPSLNRLRVCVITSPANHTLQDATIWGLDSYD